ncbi:MAG: restriction endonuclease [Holophagales bacterium]|jgi:site-specific DNA-methyltransferase (adenine-specific)|nr:restriction endonuclease [Holophagales bacterium]
MRAFDDTWTWDTAAQNGLDEILVAGRGRYTIQTIKLIAGLHGILGESPLLAYLISMTLRIVEIHRVLKPTGSFYLHCDPTASHYLKLVLDSIFCGKGGEFINEVIWHYRRWSNASQHLQKMHDVLLAYGKSRNRTFNIQLQDYSKPDAIEDTVRGVIDGKLVRLRDDQGNYIKRDKQNLGVPLHDVWHDINFIAPTSKERLGYPTQKPVSLLERIIKISSNEGDIVLDAYCGCGTTIAASEKLKRNWIGIDITYQAIAVMQQRIEDNFGKDILACIRIDGIPADIRGATELANTRDDRLRKEFEKWAVLTYTNNWGIINEKKGADGGIDGIIFFSTGHNENASMVFQVKSGKVQRGDIAKLHSDMQREKAVMATLITLDNPSKPMIAEAKAAGTYWHPQMGRNYDRIRIVTIEDMLEGKRFDLPLVNRTLKKAEKAHVPDVDQRMLPLEDTRKLALRRYRLPSQSLANAHSQE